MSYLAIDLGNKRCGIATSSEGIAFPREVVLRANLVTWLKKYCKINSDISHMIVGLPYDLYGIDTRQLDKTNLFISKLEEVFPKVKIVGHDERFSSFQANEGFNDHKDDVAAACILQSYLDSIS